MLVTGVTGGIGSRVAAALEGDYCVVGMDLDCEGDEKNFSVDLRSTESVTEALNAMRESFGSRIASVVHLAAYFDFSGEDNPLYKEVNVDGTRRLLEGLQSFDVEQFLYSSTMLVHEPTRPGVPITEDSPLDPAWPYPQKRSATLAGSPARRHRCRRALGAAIGFRTACEKHQSRNVGGRPQFALASRGKHRHRHLAHVHPPDIRDGRCDGRQRSRDRRARCHCFDDVAGRNCAERALPQCDFWRCPHHGSLGTGRRQSACRPGECGDRYRACSAFNSSRTNPQQLRQLGQIHHLTTMRRQWRR